MIDITWTLFLGASLALIVIPGQDMLLVMSRSITQGAVAGLTTATGVCCGLVVHTVLAALGVGALIRASDGLYLGLRLSGAAYLACLGLQLLRAAPQRLALTHAAPKLLLRLFADGALSNVCNPKIAVFYVAFLPQFVSPGATSPERAVFVPGLVFTMLALLVKGPIGLVAGALSGSIAAHPRALAGLFKTGGLVLLGLGLQLALQQPF